MFSLAMAIFTFTPLLRAADGQSFGSPQDAVNALVTAAENDDTNALHTIFGSESQQLVSPDAVQAANARSQFVGRLKEKIQMLTNTDNSISLQIGNDAWPFPIPLVVQGGQWVFDTAAGKQEILNRRIGMDEMGAINVCRAYVEAQREYASRDRTGDGVLAYAQNLRSDTGTHDGLYWPAQPGEALSPFGPLIAAARGEGYQHTAHMLSDQLAPYHGYYFRILKRQGSHAAGGKYNYVINGRMIAGFALVAWPAEWDNTGVMTFIVNQQGIVYQRDLGVKTDKIASHLTEFDPDKEWVMVQ
jgi:hypothetical protein